MIHFNCRPWAVGVTPFLIVVAVTAGCNSSAQPAGSATTSMQAAPTSAPPSSVGPANDAGDSPACALLPTQAFEQVFAETPTHITPVAAIATGSACTYYVSTVNGPEDGQVTVKVICGKGAEGDMFALEGANNTLPQVGPGAYDSLDTQMQPAGSDFVSNSEEIYVDNDSAGSTAGQPAAGSRERLITALSIAVHNNDSVQPCGAQPSGTSSAS